MSGVPIAPKPESLMKDIISLTLLPGTAICAPALVDALASLDCLVEEIFERHTHAIVIGAVQTVRCRRQEVRPFALAQPVRDPGLN